MRIAVSGSHHTGKSTLIADLHEALGDHQITDEPYHLMEEEGYEFSDPPSLQDFEQQLRRSLLTLRSPAADALFDRCPLDFLGYIAALPNNDLFGPDRWLPVVTNAIRTLDLIVFVRIETPDLIALPTGEDASFRRAADASLQEIILDDSLDLGFEAIEVTGTRPQRLTTVLRHINNPQG